MVPHLLRSYSRIFGQRSYFLEIDRAVATLEVDQTLDLAVVIVPPGQQLHAEQLDVLERVVSDSRPSQSLGNLLAFGQLAVCPGLRFRKIALDTLHGVSQPAATHVHFAIEFRS